MGIASARIPRILLVVISWLAFSERLCAEVVDPATELGHNEVLVAPEEPFETDNINSDQLFSDSFTTVDAPLWSPNLGYDNGIYVEGG